MSDFLKKIKGLFIEDDPNANVESPVTPAKNIPNTIPINTSPKIESQPIIRKSPEIRNVDNLNANAFDEILLKTMENANQEGFDYIEFKQSLKSLAGMQMTDEVRFKSAFAMAQTMGVSKDILLGSANHYLKVLSDEESRFADSLQKQVSEQIDHKKTAIQAQSNSIEDKQKQIEALTKQIADHKKEMQVLSDQMAEVSTKIEATKNKFSTSYQQLIGQIQSDIDKMKLFLI